MGQRSQIILITPEVYYNENNGNNNAGKIFEYHNQWRYGENAIIVLSDIFKKFEALKKSELDQELGENKNVYFKSQLNKNIQVCIRYSENHRLDWDMQQSNEAVDFTEYLLDFDSDDYIRFLESNTDNNNGYFIIKG